MSNNPYSHSSEEIILVIFKDILICKLESRYLTVTDFAKLRG